ncbi:uncharacterized protein LOC142931635 isoform X3 [Anarhichas minor]|uniref:uncharacterized protein LOC142931635 isoform X3 n=1 Tax=Anarhichas minor TaxID=65739 RepID=UPI003F7328A3
MLAGSRRTRATSAGQSENMSKVQMLRCLVNQRLTAAAEEIFGVFERTIAEYEEELSRSKEENERQRKLLDAVFIPQLRLHRADVQQLLIRREVVPPEQQVWSSSLDQEDPEPPHIKEEQEELWTSQEGEQLQGLEEADIKFTFTPVKSEDDEEEAQSSKLHQRQTEQMETEGDGEDCGGPEPDRNSDPDTDNETEDSSEPETDDSDDWKQNRDHQSGSNSLKNVLDDEEEAQSSQLHQRQTQENREEEHLTTETEDPLPGRPYDRLLSASSDEKKPLYRILSVGTKRKRRAHNPKIAATVRRLHNSKANRRRYDTAQGMKSPHNEAVTTYLVEALAAMPDLHSVHHDVLLSACKSYFEFVRKCLAALVASQRTTAQSRQRRRTIW